LAGIGVSEGFSDAGFYFIKLTNKVTGDAQRLEKVAHYLGMIVSPPVTFAKCTAITHYHHQGHVMTEGETRNRFTALSDSGVLHNHQAFFSGEVSACDYAGQVRFIAD
jgi:hypothetical protein